MSIRYLEFISFFVLLPILFLTKIISLNILIPILWGVALYCLWILRKNKLNIDLEKIKLIDLKYILIRFTLASMAYIFLQIIFILNFYLSLQ